MRVGIPAGSSVDDEAIAERLATSDTSSTVAPPRALADDDLDLVLVFDWGSLAGVVEAGIDAPLLPVDGPTALGPVPQDSLPAAIDDVGSDGLEPVIHPTLQVRTGDTRATAVREVFLGTIAPATISEFAIADAGERLVTYRADGICIATPAGSGEYARSAGGATVRGGLTTMSVVPVAPYRMDPRTWLTAGPVEVTVVRDEGAVGGVVDGAEIGEIDVGEDVTVALGSTYRVYAMDAT